VRVLYVSTLHLFKHQWNVVSAVAALRRELTMDIYLDLVGGGEPRARERLNSSINEHGAHRWTTVREVPAEEMPRVHEESDIFVFASSIEAWPITLGEAMASGLPIACSDRMAMPDILRDAGIYFDPEDPTSIADALRPLLTDSAIRLECAARAQQYATEFTWKRSATGVVAFLHRVHEETR
jgi:glycosyltransferase involved in cell wall biosynthesis